MDEKKVKELSGFLKEDYLAIINIIQNNKDYELFNHNLKSVKDYQNNFSLNYDSFKEVINATIYENEEPDSIIHKRLSLFKEVFLDDFGEFSSFSYHTILTEIIVIEDPIRELYFKALFSIFCKAIVIKLDFFDEIKKQLEEWKDCIISNKLNVQIKIPMANIFVKGIYSIVENSIYLYGNSILKLIKKDGGESTYSNPYILFKTQMKGFLYKSFAEKKTRSDNKKILNEDWDKLLLDIQEILCTFYLCGVDFEYEDFFLELPWWFTVNQKKLKEILTKHSSKPKISINNSILENIRDLFPLVKHSKYFSEEQYIIIYHNYMQVFNHEYTPDILVDIAILFEFLFAKNTHENITFWLSFNAGIFLAKDEESFLEIYRFFKKFYQIRSALVHGDKWYSRFEKMLLKDYGTDQPTPFLNICKQLLNSSLKKLIQLREANPDILNDIYGLNKKENRIKKVRFLQKLAKSYEENGAYPESIKILTEGLKEFEMIENNEDLENELIATIEKLYEQKGNIIIFSDEFQKVLIELNIIIKLDKDRMALANDAKEKISKLIKTIHKENNDDVLNLDINGFEIMDILGLAPGSKIGEIIMELKEKVMKEELKNTKFDLENYIFNNY